MSNRVGKSPNGDEPRWHAALAILAAIILYVTLPSRLTIGPVWIFPVLVLAVLVPLLIFSPSRHQETPAQRMASIVLIVIVNVFNLISVIRLVADILQGGAHTASGQALFISGAQVWATNILVYALWFWEIDGGGPDTRGDVGNATQFQRADFLFPQMNVPDGQVACLKKNWKPLFVDYFYVAFTNALAFSPTDAMPISRAAKMFMFAEAITSFATIAVVVSRGIGIIS